MSTSAFQCLAGGSQVGWHRQVQTLTPHLPLLPPTPPPGFPGGQGPRSPEWASPPVSPPLPAGSPIHQPLAGSTVPLPPAPPCRPLPVQTAPSCCPPCSGRRTPERLTRAETLPGFSLPPAPAAPSPVDAAPTRLPGLHPVLRHLRPPPLPPSSPASCFWVFIRSIPLPGPLFHAFLGSLPVQASVSTEASRFLRSFFLTSLLPCPQDILYPHPQLLIDICLMTQSVGLRRTGLSFPTWKGQNWTPGVKGLHPLGGLGLSFVLLYLPGCQEKGIGGGGRCAEQKREKNDREKNARKETASGGRRQSPGSAGKTSPLGGQRKPWGHRQGPNRLADP